VSDQLAMRVRAAEAELRSALTEWMRHRTPDDPHDAQEYDTFELAKHAVFVALTILRWGNSSRTH